MPTGVLDATGGEYTGYYKDAAGLAAGVECPGLRLMAVRSALLACMQPDFLPALLDADLPVDPRGRFPSRLLPDRRLQMVLDGADGVLWRTAWERCRSECAAMPGWDALFSGARTHAQCACPDDDRLWPIRAALDRALYAQVAALLDRERSPTLAYDGHRPLVPSVIEAVEAASPKTRGRMVLPDPSLSVVDEALDSMHRERLVLRRVGQDDPVVAGSPSAPRLRARWARLVDFVDDPTLRVVSGRRSQRHVFVAVRPAGRLLQQYVLDSGTAVELADRGDTPVAVIRRCDGLRADIDMVELSSPQELSVIVGSRPGNRGVVSCVSLSALGDHAWVRMWGGVLQRTTLFGLFDLDPIANFGLWRTEGRRVRYATSDVVAPGGIPMTVLAVRPDHLHFPLLLPTTRVTARLLVDHLRRNVPASREKPSLLSPRLRPQRRQLLAEVLTHLLTEEPWFDTMAYRTDDAAAHGNGAPQ
ncbi:hypothetical protein [Streptomyces sp. NPDC007905]|uniref:hypothetical protein n=1 Tax=Streptomyces sp. NPDC007905 TaxID=3364788 RepID=UPI0036F14CA6